VDLSALGVFAAAEKADLEVLLQLLEQQLDLPALFVELRDVGSGAREVVSEQIKRRVVIGAGDDDLAQLGPLKAGSLARVARRSLAGELYRHPRRGDGRAAVQSDAEPIRSMGSPVAAIKPAITSGSSEA
jgi:hypothetical protein